MNTVGSEAHSYFAVLIHKGDEKEKERSDIGLPPVSESQGRLQEVLGRLSTA